MITRDKRASRDVRHLRIRRRIRGSAERPRLVVFRSLNHIYGQLIDDDSGKTLAAVDSRSPDFRARQKSGGNIAAARIVGELLAERAKARGVERVVFDRGGYQYHGRVKALADAARAGGLHF
ncbi:MAG: 50S ribosomal protein L18 [Candidatus Rokuibacteriota bacterium]|nr:MAG: 50S ribosomal protein L18 [Candidatus Rokubacteria bacterium]